MPVTGGRASNLSDEQRALGLREISKLVKTWDVNPTFGGPIKRDRVWFFVTARALRARKTRWPGFSSTGTQATRRSGPTMPANAAGRQLDNVTKNASSV